MVALLLAFTLLRTSFVNKPLIKLVIAEVDVLLLNIGSRSSWRIQVNA